MKHQKTVEKINKILGVDSYLGIPRGTIASINYETYPDGDVYLLRHGIIAKSGDRYVYAY